MRQMYGLRGVTRLNVQRTAALVAAIVVIGVQLSMQRTIVPNTDSLDYLSIASELSQTGIFTDGRFKVHAAVTGPHGEGMFFAPLYPAFLAVLMKVDRPFYDTAVCVVENHSVAGQCPLNLALPVLIQGLLAAFSAFLVWLSAVSLTGKKSVGWLAMGLVLLVRDAYSFYAAELMTENLTFPLFSLACFLGTSGLQHKRSSRVLFSGIVLGFLALNRPSFPFLFYAISVSTLCASVFMIATRKRRITFLTPLVLFVIGYAVIVTPWVVRNGLTLHSYEISKGYGVFILQERVAFDSMTSREWAASFIFGLPDFGDSLAKRLLPPADYERLDYGATDGFYLTGNREKPLWQSPGEADRRLHDMIHHYIVANLLKHMLVTLSLAWRGMWVGKYWGLVTIPVFAGVAIHALRTRWWPFLLYAFPAWYMLAFNAFLTVNVVRYNLVLLPCLAIATAWSLVAFWQYSRKTCFIRPA